MIRRVKRVKIQNPTDLEFLKKIKIKKIIRKHYYYYHILLNNKKIGEASVPIEYEYPYVNIIEIDEKFQRKGLATYLYNFIEKDLNVELKPSEYLEFDGESFWKNRLKRKNPTDFEFLKQIVIDKEIFKITDGKDRITSYQYNVYFEGKRIGYAEIVKSQNTVGDIEVLKPYQRKGLTTFLYDYIEKDLKIKLKPSEYLDPDGKKFWESRLKSSKR
jgi:hypothetical protein